MADLQRELLGRQVYLSSYGMGCWSMATTADDIDHFVSSVIEAATR